VDGRKAIYCHFENKDADFFKIASTGTRSLALFYYWYIRMKKASLVFIDEFDAFYHFELSEAVQKKVNEIPGVQIFTTTHNTDLMSNDLLRPDCYFLLKNNDIRPLSNLTEKELRQAHNLQKMYKAGAFNG
jgi:AAA15 family ATPase/GTPase